MSFRSSCSQRRPSGVGRCCATTTSAMPLVIAEPVVMTLGVVDAESGVRGRPVHRAHSYARPRYRSELFWSATTAGHVVYEIRLELDWLLPADIDT
jgi:hypothetical protein